MPDVQKFIQGTTNHLVWTMRDATDFETPESALSAITTIKIYGMLNGNTGVNFVTSGTGSLTNDITHVGPSATGTYHIGLATADLSDASAAFYDLYVIHLSATGAARNTLIVPGERCDTSYISNILSNLSAVLSDFQSDFESRVPAVVGTASDLASKVWAEAPGAAVSSRLLLTLSRVSDLQSFVSDMNSDLRSLVTTTGVQLNTSMLSDLRSAISVGPTATVTASDISDIASAVWAFAAGVGRTLTASGASDIASAVWAHTIGARVDSRILLNLSRISDVYSLASDMNSDLRSLLTTTGVPLDASTMSDLRSAITVGPTATVTASDISDIASAVWAAATRTLTANVGLIASDMSDLRSAIAAGPAATVTASDISDIASAVWGAATRTLTANVSLNASDLSDLRSAIAAGPTTAVTASDVSDIASAVKATLASDLSDIYSSISDLRSQLGGTIGELTQAAPTATPTIKEALMLLYMALRNQGTTTATTLTISNDGGTVICRATLSDDGTTFTKTELASGP